MINKGILLLCFSIACIGCNNRTKTTTETEHPLDTIVAVVPQNDITALAEDTTQVQLDGGYVTSIKMPHETYAYVHMFDGDATTHWATMPGAGPDEGMMLYFQKPQDITTLQLNQVVGDMYAKVTQVAIYINGKPPIYTTVEDTIVLQQEKVSSMYIRFTAFEGDTNRVEINATLHATTFDLKKSIGISELVLYSGGSALPIRPVMTLKGMVNASSTLAPEQSYDVHHLFDARKEFAWSEGVEGNGEGESFSVQLTSPTTLTGIKIYNGYQRSSTHYAHNARVKSIQVTTENGASAILQLKDVEGQQEIVFPTALVGKKYTFTIQELYPGAKYTDALISELKLINGTLVMGIKNQYTEDLKTKVLQKIEGTVLTKYMDRSIANSYADAVDYQRAIILRSDHTFVFYDHKKDRVANRYTEALIMDGNWEFVELNAERAKIRVFGKLSKLSETVDYYKGKSKNSHQQIFQDFLMIDAKGIQGEKFIEPIVFPSATTK